MLILATNSAKHFKLDSGDYKTGRFSDGEVSVKLEKRVEGGHVFIIASTEPPAENLVEALFLTYKVVNDGAARVTLIIPYLGYSRGDREAKKGEIASLAPVGKMIKAVGGDKIEIVCFDLHSPRTREYFPCPLTEIVMTEKLADKFAGLSGLTIVAPDEGAEARAKKFAQALHIKEIVKIKKRRLTSGEVKIAGITGKVGIKAVIVDDMVQTGGTIIETAKVLKTKGAKEIFVAATHMVYPAGGFRKLADSALISRIITTDTICPPKDLSGKFEIIGIASEIKHLIRI